jgi:hypothetical protein
MYKVVWDLEINDGLTKITQKAEGRHEQNLERPQLRAKNNILTFWHRSFTFKF